MSHSKHCEHICAFEDIIILPMVFIFISSQCVFHMMQSHLKEKSAELVLSLKLTIYVKVYRLFKYLVQYRKIALK